MSDRASDYTRRLNIKLNKVAKYFNYNTEVFSRMYKTRPRAFKALCDNYATEYNTVDQSISRITVEELIRNGFSEIKEDLNGKKRLFWK